MNIWIIQLHEPTHLNSLAKKMRTFHLVEELKKYSHITWFTSAHNHFTKKWIYPSDKFIKYDSNTSFYFIRGVGYSKNFSLRRFLDSRILALKMYFLFKKLDKPDLIICSLPNYDVCYYACKYAVMNTIPFIVDVRDKWPDNFLDPFNRYLKKFITIFLFFEYRMIKYIFKHSNHIISISSGLLNWAKGFLTDPINKNCTVLYLGSEKLKSVSNNKNFSNVINKLNNKIVILFFGTFGFYHNPQIILELAKKCSKNNFHFIIAGKGFYEDELNKLANNLDNVSFVGWLNIDELNFILTYCNLGICPVGSNLNYDFFPNKAFTYMSAGLPLLNGFSGDIKEDIDKFSIGYNYDSLDDLFKFILYLELNPNHISYMKNNISLIYDDYFSVNIIYKKYADIVLSLLKD